jgi:hypothetical protein
MAKFFSESRPDAKYKLDELISTEILIHEPHGPVQIICDIDKTYIETRFESAMSMLKLAFENADQKQTVTGAPIALLAARWGEIYGDDPDILSEPRPLHFLSASPPQLRRVIRSKLAMDGMDWTSDTFKNQAYNIKMGRLRFLKQHVAYKTATILTHVSKAPEGTRFVLIGDNAELDAVIYLGVQMFLDGSLSRSAYRDYLSFGGVNHEVLPSLEGKFSGKGVGGILIRRAPGYPLVEAPPLSDMVTAFDHYFEVLLHFYAWGLVPGTAIWPACRQLHNEYGYPREELVSCLRQGVKYLPRDQTSPLAAAESRLSESLPLLALPDKSSFQPGKVSPRLELEEAQILEASKNWVQIIAARENK